MKYCVKCGSPMDDEMQFCQRCGAKCVSPAAETDYTSQEDSYAEYWGFHYRDLESGNEIELTPEGVHIFHAKGMKKFRFDKTIPYADILEVNSVRATAMKSGYMSIITATEGITGNAARQQLLFDHNTVMFTKKTEPEAERIYRAIEDICSAPPQTNAPITYYESNPGKQTRTQSPTLSNPTKPKKRSGCLVPIVILVVFLIVAIAIPKPDTNENSNAGNSTQQTEQEEGKNPEDYEGDVFTAFWESASDFFGVEYSDYKWTHTATSYICDYKTSDGYTAHYYLIETAFETKNAFGQDILHKVTARCYYVPDYNNTVYNTYLTLDGEAVYFDKEKENWLMDMG